MKYIQSRQNFDLNTLIYIFTNGLFLRDKLLKKIYKAHHKLFELKVIIPKAGCAYFYELKIGKLL